MSWLTRIAFHSSNSFFDDDFDFDSFFLFRRVIRVHLDSEYLLLTSYALHGIIVIQGKGVPVGLCWVGFVVGEREDAMRCRGLAGPSLAGPYGSR